MGIINPFSVCILILLLILGYVLYLNWKYQKEP